MNKFKYTLAIAVVALGYSFSAVAISIANVWTISSTSEINCGASPHGLWTNSLNAGASACNDYFNFDAGSTLTENGDGTAVINATATNPDGITADIDISFGAYTTVHADVKTAGGPQLTSWYYYETITSGNIAILGVDYDITLHNPNLVLQIGFGANDKTGAFGASVWMDADDGLATGGYTGGHWDLNMDLAAVPVPAAAWLFGSGLIGLVGVARRQA